ncbi:MAG: MASE1 domain-containing protein, partial [Zavarzinia sp.]|nr:MASE1 domain-containing protein [Zavarzinia sp.]
MTLRQTDNIFDAQASRVETSTTSGVGWRFSLLAFALYLGSAALSLLVSNTVSGVATMWFANAVLIGLIWRNRGRGLLMAMAGSVLASVIIKTAAGGSPFVALALSAVNLLEIALALWLIDRVNCGRRGTYAEVPVILLGGIVAPLASALAAAFILHPYPETGISDFWPLWWTWWTGSALGAIIALPIVLTARRCAIRDAFTGRRAIEFALIAPPSLAFAAYLAAENEFPLVMVSVVLMLAATRLNRFATALLSAVCATLVLTIISHDWHIADDVDGIMRHLPVLVPAWIAMAAPYFVALLR